MPNSVEIEKIFGDFLESSLRRGALLICGEWGSGKTHLVTKKLRPLAERKGFKTAYISVADIDSLESFETSLFLASFHWMEKKRIKPLAEAVMHLGRHWSNKFGLPPESIIAAGNEFSNKTIVFVDDLERAGPELRKRILYRIASLRELKSARAVILADETKITQKVDEEYNTIKEKVVARTVEYLPTYQENCQHCSSDRTHY